MAAEPESRTLDIVMSVILVALLGVVLGFTFG